MKNNRIRYYLSLWVILFVSIFTGNAQQTDTVYMNNIVSSFKQVTNLPQEKVYLHTDKPYYFAGDTIWLKAYLVNAITHFSGNGSHYVYVELINRKNKVQQRIKVQQREDIFSSFIPLPKSLEAGDYYLRAYTHWMLNEKSDYYFSKNLKVFASQSSFMYPEIRYEQKGKKRIATVTFKRPDNTVYAGNYVHYMVRTKPYENKFRQQQTNKNGEIQIDIPEKDKIEQYIYVVLEDKQLKHKHTFYVPDAFDYHVDFFPEGGSLISGCTQKVGIKAIDTNGNSVEVTGSILNSKGDTITHFKSSYAGIGSFMLPISIGEKYKAVVSSITGDMKKEFLLPDPEADKFSLSITERNGIIHYTILHSPQERLPDNLYLIAHVRGFLLFVQPIQKGQGAVSLKSIPEGILTLTLLDGNYVPHSERLVFVRQNHSIWQLASDKASYGSRSPISLDIHLSDLSGQPITGDFSLSVTDNYAIRCDSTADNILSNLLLTSDIKGYIETPGYYFKDNSQRLKACLDNLMLTQGWNRFNVEDILKEQQKNPKYFMEIGQTISGKVLDIRNKPLSGKTVNVFVNKRPYPSTHTDNDGVFIVDKLSFADTARVEAQVIEKGKFFRANIRIDRDYFPEAVNTHPYKDAKYEQQNEYREEMQSPFVREDGVLMLRLPEVVINARSLVKDRFSSYKMDDEEMLAQQDARTALDLVKNVPGFRIIDNRPYINPKYSQRPEHLMSNDVNNRNALRPKEKIDYGRTARFMLDNKTISFNALSLINAEDIVGVHKIDPEVDAAVNITQNLKYLEAAYNEAFESGATLEELEELEVDRQLQKMKDGTQSISGGCIVLTSRTGNLEIPRTSQGDTAFLLGFNRYKSFYSPKYVTGEERKSLVPDNRTTIYCQPHLRTDERGNASLHFFTADRPSYYTIIIEGITDKGVPCRYEHLLKR
nr:hypothetical protein [Bacteroides intestinalis]